MTERLRALEVEIKVQAERIEGIRIALARLKDDEKRITDQQHNAMTLDRFSDYEKTQRRALDLALTAAADRVADLAERVLVIEQTISAGAKTWTNQTEANRRKSDRATTWMVAGLGATMTAVVIVVNWVLG